MKVVNLIKLDEIIKDQGNNEDLQKIKNKMILKNKIYYKKLKLKEKIILSESFSKEFMRQIHEDYCHIGIIQLQKKIMPFYTARNLVKNIKETCRNCKE